MSKHRKEINKLLTFLKRGKTTYFKELYEMTYNHLLGIAAFYLFDKSEKEDVVLEAYMKMLQYIRSFDTKQDGYNWMCRIVQNVAYDFNKKRQPLLSDVAIASNKEGQSIEEIFEESLERSDLNDAIKTLSATEQKILYYRYWEDLTYEEIAEKLHMKRTSVFDKIKKIEKNFSKYL